MADPLYELDGEWVDGKFKGNIRKYEPPTDFGYSSYDSSPPESGVDGLLICLLSIVFGILFIWMLFSGLIYFIDESNKSRGLPTYQEYLDGNRGH